MAAPPSNANPSTFNCWNNMTTTSFNSLNGAWLTSGCESFPVLVVSALPLPASRFLDVKKAGIGLFENFANRINTGCSVGRWSGVTKTRIRR
jgi:hypothetical protein